MIWRRIRELWRGSEAAGDPHAIWLYVQCARCGAPVAVRADRRYDLNPDESGTGYILVKEIMDDRCFQLMQAEVRLDSAHRVVEQTIEGGRFLSAEEYQRLRSAAERPQP